MVAGWLLACVWLIAVWWELTGGVRLVVNGSWLVVGGWWWLVLDCWWIVGLLVGGG